VDYLSELNVPHIVRCNLNKFDATKFNNSVMAEVGISSLAELHRLMLPVQYLLHKDLSRMPKIERLCLHISRCSQSFLQF
jgi:hypothetical protein